jgi:hypothetical protein
MTDPDRRPDVRQEDDKLSWRKALLVTLSLIGITLLLVLWAGTILRRTVAELRPPRQYPERELGPRREVSGLQERLFMQGDVGELGAGQALNRKKQAELSSFGWIDKENGLVHIPIEEAMQLLVEESHR